MPLTPPTVQDLEDFSGETFDSSQITTVQMHLQAATDLMELATGIHSDFESNSLEYRVLQRGILDMTWYVGTSMEERDAMFSAFSSERIGSYSYNKASKAAATGLLTGVPFFDLAVAFLSGLAEPDDPWYGRGGIAISAEGVMPDQDWYHDVARNPYFGWGVD